MRLERDDFRRSEIAATSAYERSRSSRKPFSFPIKLIFRQAIASVRRLQNARSITKEGVNVQQCAEK